MAVALNEWTTHTSCGKPYPAASAPCPPPNEAERLSAVEEILQTYPEPRADIAAILSLLHSSTEVDSVAISLLTRAGTLMKQTIGLLPEGKCFAAPGICHWLLEQPSPEVLVIDDLSQDARSSTKAVVTESPYMKSYAAAPMMSKSNFCIGSLCLWSTTHRDFSNAEMAILANLSEVIMRLLETTQHQCIPSLIPAPHQRASIVTSSTEQMYAIVDTREPNWPILFASRGFLHVCNSSAENHGALWTLFQRPNQNQPLTLPQGEQETVIRGVRNPLNKALIFDCTILPADADKLDENAIEIAKPFRELCSNENNTNFLYFVTLAPAKVSRRLMTPFKGVEVGRLLGKGCYGRVYIAKTNGKTVALKVVDEFEHTVEIDGIPAEASLLEDINHPSLVRLLSHKLTKHSGAQPEKKRLWLLTEFCNRGSLHDAVDKGEFRLSNTPDAAICMPSILKIAQEVASGLHHLHEAGILHCDLSGGNVFLYGPPQSTKPHSAKIGDFGLCRPQMMECPPNSSGTRACLAPEVMSGGSYTSASDIYALGVILYELFCCQRAWAGLDDFQVTYAVQFCGEELTMPEDAPPGYSQLASACLNRHPTERPSAAEVVHELSILDQQRKLSASEEQLHELKTGSFEQSASRLVC